MEQRRVVISGIGLATPLGTELEPFWTALIDQTPGISKISAFAPDEFRSQVAGQLPKFMLKDFIPKSYRKNSKVMCRDIQLALIAAYRAVVDAGLVTKCLIDRQEAEPPTNLDPTRFGANIGAGLICADLEELACALASAEGEAGAFSLENWGAEGMSNLTPLWLLKFLPNMLACHVTIVHDAQAPSNTITCGEASSHLAISEAYRTIARGAADVCICGGAESKLNCMSLIRDDLFDRLSTEFNDDPARACRPFDEQPSGTAISEGGGLVILESLDHALERGAKIYGEVIGVGASCNTKSWKQADPEGRGISTAMGKALQDASIQPSDVDMMVSFGTGIKDYDQSEAAAITTTFQDHTADMPVMAIKSSIGNNGAGSGAIDFAAGLLAMKNNTVPPSLHTQTLSASCPINLIREQPVDARIDHFMSVAYALSGGQTAAIVVKRYSE